VVKSTLADRTIRELLAGFASPNPTPGGGSASALAAALGAALMRMVAGLPRTRHGSEEDRVALSAAAAALEAIQDQLVESIDSDAAAYDGVIGAYRLPKSNDAERSARTAAVQEALGRATDVPLQVMRLAIRALQHGEAIAAHGHAAASSDVGVGAELLRAGFQGARLNVQANVIHLSNNEDRDRATVEVDELERALSETLEALNQPPEDLAE
jgi:glutamate formiminotransferase/formiminotetrahydrofolate cyclodeaminase